MVLCKTTAHRGVGEGMRMEEEEEEEEETSFLYRSIKTVTTVTIGTRRTFTRPSEIAIRDALTSRRDRQYSRVIRATSINHAVL